jgi:hypothetical protein
LIYNTEPEEHNFINALVYSREVKTLFISVAIASLIFVVYVLIMAGVLDGHFYKKDLFQPDVQAFLIQFLVFQLVLLLIYKRKTSGRLVVNPKYFVYHQFLRKVKIKWVDIDRVIVSPRKKPQTLKILAGDKTVEMSKYLVDCRGSRRIIHNPILRFWVEESGEPFPIDLDHSVALWVVGKYRGDLVRGLCVR